MESSIGYRNEDDYAGNWTELARSRELRPLRCNATVVSITCTSKCLNLSHTPHLIIM